MAHVVQQRDIDILFQPHKELFFKLELLNRRMKVIDSLEGHLISDSFNISAESDIRRSYSCELFVENSSFLIGADKKIWIDRYIRPYIGIKHMRTQEVVWYLNGTYVFNDVNYSYDDSTKTLSLSCSDPMCTLNGDRGGSVEGLSISIDAGSYIRNVIISLLQEAGITKFKVFDIGKTIPFDLQFSVGVNYYQILKEVTDLYAGYEMFFDIDGTFIYQPIPTTKFEMSILDETIINPLVISENPSNSFNKIYNSTQVWGKVIETDYYTQTSTSNGTSYTATYPNMTALDNFAKYGVRVSANNTGISTLNINNLGARLIIDDNGKPVATGRLLANKDYVFKYRQATNDFLLLGQYQAYGEFKLYDSDCQFSITNLGYEIKQTKHFDELESDDLCYQRAKYETWLATRFQDKINLQMARIPFLDVNRKITYKSYLNNKLDDYIIKSISGSNSSFTVNVEMIKYSVLYPDII